MIPFNSSSSNFFRFALQRYNHTFYWNIRNIVIDSSRRVPYIIKIFLLFLIKWTDAFNCASFGTNINNGAVFLSPPNLPHGPNGIIIGHDVVIGFNCTIFQQVTVAHGGVVIGDNCLIGAGAKILSGVRIGDNVKIGANCVIVENIPNNATVVMHKPRIIIN